MIGAKDVNSIAPIVFPISFSRIFRVNSLHGPSDIKDFRHDLIQDESATTVSTWHWLSPRCVADLGTARGCSPFCPRSCRPHAHGELRDQKRSIARAPRHQSAPTSNRNQVPPDAPPLAPATGDAIQQPYSPQARLRPAKPAGPPEHAHTDPEL